MSIEQLYQEKLKVINIGVVDIYKTLETQGVKAVHVELPQEEAVDSGENE